MIILFPSTVFAYLNSPCPRQIPLHNNLKKGVHGGIGTSLTFIGNH